MPLSQLFVIYLIGTLIVLLPSFGLAPLFKKAGVPAWKAYIPFYNTWVMQEIATGMPLHREFNETVQQFRVGDAGVFPHFRVHAD